MRRLAIAVVLTALVAASTGTGCQALQYQQMADAVKPHGIEVTGVEVRGSSLIPTSVVLHLNAIIWNGSDYVLEIEKAEYTVYIRERKVHEDTIYGLELEPEMFTHVPVSVNISIAELGIWVWDYLTEGVEMRVVGTLHIPLRIWGFKITAIQVPFDESTYYSLSQPQGLIIPGVPSTPPAKALSPVTKRVEQPCHTW
ncbi:MAG: hypothetical protein ACLFVD_04045 [Dehalococcoidia bacterium]